MLHFEVLMESFRRGHDYDITSVQKNTGETWAWLIVATPKQAEKMEKKQNPILVGSHACDHPTYSKS